MRRADDDQPGCDVVDGERGGHSSMPPAYVTRSERKLLGVNSETVKQAVAAGTHEC